MLVTNYSNAPHRYQEPGSGGSRYLWDPGETLDVPDGVARLVRRLHPSKFTDPNLSDLEEGVSDSGEHLTSDMQSGESGESGEEDYQTGVAQPRPRRNRRS